VSLQNLNNNKNSNSDKTHKSSYSGHTRNQPSDVPLVGIKISQKRLRVNPNQTRIKRKATILPHNFGDAGTISKTPLGFNLK